MWVEMVVGEREGLAGLPSLHGMVSVGAFHVYACHLHYLDQCIQITDTQVYTGVRGQ